MPFPDIGDRVALGMRRSKISVDDMTLKTIAERPMGSDHHFDT